MAGVSLPGTLKLMTGLAQTQHSNRRHPAHRSLFRARNSNMTVLTIRNVHGHHLGHSACDTEILASLRTSVEFAVRGQDDKQHTSLSSDMTTYPLWPDVLKLNFPEGSDGVLEVLRTTLFVCPFIDGGEILLFITCLPPGAGQGVRAETHDAHAGPSAGCWRGTSEQGSVRAGGLCAPQAWAPPRQSAPWGH